MQYVAPPSANGITKHPAQGTQSDEDESVEGSKVEDVDDEEPQGEEEEEPGR